jgi:hypothetical protein
VGKASPGREQGTVTARKLQTAREFNPTRRLTASRSAFRSNFPSRISSLTQHLRVVISRLAGPARFPRLRVISRPPSLSSFRLAKKNTNPASRKLIRKLCNFPQPSAATERKPRIRGLLNELSRSASAELSVSARFVNSGLMLIRAIDFPFVKFICVPS